MWGSIQIIVNSVVAKMRGRQADLWRHKSITGCPEGRYCWRKVNYLEFSQGVKLGSVERIK